VYRDIAALSVRTTRASFPACTHHQYIAGLFMELFSLLGLYWKYIFFTNLHPFLSKINFEKKGFLISKFILDKKG
jgi:hypothetical protein